MFGGGGDVSGERGGGGGRVCAAGCCDQSMAARRRGRIEIKTLFMDDSFPEAEVEVRLRGQIAEVKPIVPTARVCHLCNLTSYL